MDMEHPCPVLPDDIIEDIFTRLPARTALECRGLSRAWAAALSTDAFAESHRRTANSHAGPRFFFDRISYKNFTMAWTRFFTRNAWSPDGTVVTLPPLNPPVDRMRAGITQQCRGLVVVDVEERAYCVYNPSTGRLTALPPSRNRARRQLPTQRLYESLGLGYDARSGKHKVVCICYRGHKLPVVCEVYVVDNDSGEGFWRAPAARGGRQPDARKPPGWVSSYEASVFAQGHVHWMAQMHVKPKQDYDWRVTRRGLIVSFSLADEAFGVVPLPPRVDYLCEYELTELEGRLCLFTSFADDSMMWCRQRTYDVWLLRDHEAGTWDLRCRIDPDAASPEVVRFISWSVRPSPVAAMDHGRRILFMTGRAHKSSSPYVYTPATGAIESLPSGRGLMARHICKYYYEEKLATLYEESVVSPGRPHEDILFSPAATRAVCMALARHLPPPRDLARLKLVCRSWRAMIESKRFVKLQALSSISCGQAKPA